MVMTTSQLRVEYASARCNLRQMQRVKFPGDGYTWDLLVQRDTVPAWNAFAAIMRKHGYLFLESAGGTFNCRKISGSDQWSLHSYGLALDLNPSKNPHRTKKTNMSEAFRSDIKAIRTVSGEQVFAWGGDWAGTSSDPMHWQICASKTQLATGIVSGLDLDPVIINEDFEGNWQATWGGKPYYGYPTNQGNDPDKEARLLIKQGEHYGSDYRKPLGLRLRKGFMSYDLYLSGDWNPTNKTGKLPGVLDTKHEPAGYGNNKPNPEGASIRTWFGPNRQIGLYVYHKGQTLTSGDHVIAGAVPLWQFVPVLIQWNFDAGWVKMNLSNYAQVSLPVQVGADTAIDTAWLCAYFGGLDLAPSNMAADIDNLKVWVDAEDPAALVELEALLVRSLQIVRDDLQ